ncbi:uncharacterized protein LOC119980033 [Tripterygium wilfordii]|uniref:uncharacterized protein LOC119980033 n=1 Tax=Tripterygium wilfordii TaxID=458696 RepID=UPI0018F84850|nr:uncharacterized protein LOC119980033 [Tripterygium wilfordii]
MVTNKYSGGSVEPCKVVSMKEWGFEEMGWWLSGFDIDIDSVSILYRKPWRAQCHGLKLLEDEEEYIEMGWMGVEHGSVHVYVDHTKTYTYDVYMQNKKSKKECAWCGDVLHQKSPSKVEVIIIDDDSSSDGEEKESEIIAKKRKTEVNAVDASPSSVHKMVLRNREKGKETDASMAGVNKHENFRCVVGLPSMSYWEKK